MMEQMTIHDLKTGMHVVLRNGDEMIVMKGAKRDTEGLVNLPHTKGLGTWCDLNLYNNDMTHMRSCNGASLSKFDIVRVYDIAIYDDAVFTNINNNHDYDSNIIYEEEAITREEAEQRLGVRIVD